MELDKLTFMICKSVHNMEEMPYTDEQIKELKVWLNKPYESGEVHVPDSIKRKIWRLVATVDSLKRYNQLIEERDREARCP